MLSYDALIKEAESREMPATKIRGILREYLHILILKTVYQTPAGKHLFLTGGTYLRLVHHLRRFSEDLTFYTDRLPKKDFEQVLRTLKAGMEKNGIAARLSLDSRKNVCRGQLTFPGIEKDYQAIARSSRKQGIVVTLEAVKPKWPVKTETEVISGFGEFFPCLCVEKGTMFAGKIAALMAKPHARHLYDITFMLLKRFPVNAKALQALKLKKDARKIIVERVARFTKAELKKQALALQTFLFEEHESDLIINAHEIIPRLAENLK